MHTPRVTQSQTCSLVTQPSVSIPTQPVSTTSSDKVNDLFNTTTPIASPSPMSNNNEHDAPPHMNTPAPEEPQAPPPPPALDPNLQQAMAALFQAMTANMPAAPPPLDPVPHGHEGVPCQHVKAREPDPYDGTEPSKLHAFLSQCKLVFRSSPYAFANDELKIMYAVSYLKGTALHWFEPNLALDEIDLPVHAYVWQAFEEELKSTFGEPDPVTSATQKLDNLSMKDSHHITKYNVEFNEYATLTGFDNHALYAKFYKGLALRIKDSLAVVGRPTNLDGLRDRAQQLDLCYWERKDEEQATTATSRNSSAKPLSTRSSSSNATTSTSYSSRSNPAQSRNSSRASTPAASSSAAQPKSKKPDLLKILGPDRKLLPEEKERHRKNDLCMICGSKNHFADKCPSNKDKTQGRAAQLEEVDKEPDSEGSASEDSSSELPN